MMKYLLFALASIFTIFFANAQQQAIKNVNAPEFKNLIAKKDGILLDVRTQYEFESGHIKDTEQLNYYAFSFKENLLLLPKTNPFMFIAEPVTEAAKLLKF